MLAVLLAPWHYLLPPLSWAIDNDCRAAVSGTQAAVLLWRAASNAKGISVEDVAGLQADTIPKLLLGLLIYIMRLQGSIRFPQDACPLLRNSMALVPRLDVSTALVMHTSQACTSPEFAHCLPGGRAAEHSKQLQRGHCQGSAGGVLRPTQSLWDRLSQLSRCAVSITGTHLTRACALPARRQGC